MLLLPAQPAVAHGIGGRLDLPVPVSYFAAGAAVVLVLSFVALSSLWQEPRLQDGPRHEESRARVGSSFGAAAGVIGLLLVIGQLIPDLLGADREGPTIAPVLVWVVFWLVVPFVGALIGNWYTDLNPWRTLARSTRLGDVERPSVAESAGVWPATGAFLAFVWLELMYPSSTSPTALGVAALVYTVFLLVVMGVVGRETGLATFDVFTPYNRLISSISPVGRTGEGRLVWRGWLRSLPVIPEWRGLAVFMVVAIGTVSFDGLSGTSWYRRVFDDFGSDQLGATLLMLATITVVGLGYFGASWAAASFGRGWTAAGVASRFAHTLVPIALAYALAHYLTLILFEGQQLISAASDPFGLGWDLFGTADRKIDFFVTSSEPIWYAQLVVIVVGHLLAVILAHDRALADFGRGAVRSQYAMLLLMVGLTTLGLLILAG